MSAQTLEVSVSIRSRNGAPSRKGCVVNGQMTKASDKCVRPPLLLIFLISYSSIVFFILCFFVSFLSGLRLAAAAPTAARRARTGRLYPTGLSCA